MESQRLANTPLVGNENDEETTGPAFDEKDQHHHHHKEEEDKLEVGHALYKITSLAVYPIIGMVFHPAYILINTIVLGQLEDSSTLQASFGLGSLAVGIFLLSIGVCFNGALDTLVSQNYGAKEFKLIGVALNRQIFLDFCIQLPLSLPLLFSERVFLAMGQDPVIAKNASIYVIVSIPGALFYQYQNAYGRYCTGQRQMKIPMYANIGATIVHFILVYTLVFYAGWDIWAISLSSSIQFFMRYLLTKLQISFSDKFKESQVTFWQKETFQNLSHQLSLSMQSLSLGVWGWWAFDIFTLIASYMSTEAIAAQTVLRNIALLFFMIPVGISSSTSSLVGNHIGAENLIGSKFYSKMCILTGVIWGFISVVIMYLLQNVIISIFSSSPIVNQLILDAYFLLSIFVFFDCCQCVGVGIIRGLGKQGLASLITCIGYWVFGIPISLVCVFTYNMGMNGLWLGPTFAITFNFVFYYIFVINTNWQKVIDDTKERRIKEKKNI